MEVINNMKSVELTNKQARKFILLKQGLMGKHKFTEEDGVCIYSNSINVNGR